MQCSTPTGKNRGARGQIVRDAGATAVSGNAATCIRKPFMGNWLPWQSVRIPQIPDWQDPGLWEIIHNDPMSRCEDFYNQCDSGILFLNRHLN
jgi:hypothetical protein